MRDADEIAGDKSRRQGSNWLCVRAALWTCLTALAAVVAAGRLAAADVPLRQKVERGLGPGKNGHFLLAMWEVTSAPGQPVNLTAKVYVFDSREAARDAAEQYLQAEGNTRNFRLIQRFDANPVAKDFAEQCKAEFEAALRSVDLPKKFATKVGIGKINTPEFTEIYTGPDGVRISVTRMQPKAKKITNLVLAMP